ncbi:MAG: OmpA family protein [Alphaproteobacteria bacterium]
MSPLLRLAAVGGLAVLSACAAIEGMTQAPKTAAYIVFFDRGSADLGTDAGAVVDRAARDAASARPAVVRVSGYTDRVGSFDQNFRLAEQRTVTVEERLVARGVPAERIRREPIGQAVASTVGTESAQDRRVEITFADE